MSDLNNNPQATKSTAARIAQARAVLESQHPAEDSTAAQQYRGFANIDEGPPVEDVDRGFASRAPSEVRGFASDPTV